MTWNITITKEQTADLCQAIADANRTLRRVKRGDKSAYLVSLAALDLSVDKIGADADNYPDQFYHAWTEYIPWGALDGVEKKTPDEFATAYGELYRKIDERLIPALGADNETLLRGMVALGATEINKP